MSIILTNKAAEHVLNKLNERNKGLGIRLGVRSSGCSGFAYYLEYVDILDKNDYLFEDKHVTIFIDKKSLPFVTGITLNYTSDGLNEGFEYINPNEKNQCGCGESFNI
jgi:iron-sulfur cluster assembly protein